MSFNLNYSVVTNPSPCSKNCQKRSPSCHCTCEDYKTWKEELDTRREAIRKQKDMIICIVCTERMFFIKLQKEIKSIDLC